MVSRWVRSAGKWAQAQRPACPPDEYNLQEYVPISTLLCRARMCWPGLSSVDAATADQLEGALQRRVADQELRDELAAQDF